MIVGPESFVLYPVNIITCNLINAGVLHFCCCRRSFRRCCCNYFFPTLVLRSQLVQRAFSITGVTVYFRQQGFSSKLSGFFNCNFSASQQLSLQHRRHLFFLAAVFCFFLLYLHRSFFFGCFLRITINIDHANNFRSFDVISFCFDH